LDQLKRGIPVAIQVDKFFYSMKGKDLTNDVSSQDIFEKGDVKEATITTENGLTFEDGFLAKNSQVPLSSSERIKVEFFLFSFFAWMMLGTLFAFFSILFGIFLNPFWLKIGVPFLLINLVLGFMPTSKIVWPSPITNTKLYSQLCRHFSLKVVLTSEFSNILDSETMIFSSVPHSIFPLGNVLLLPSLFIFLKRKVMGLTTTAMIHAPILRHIFIPMGVTTASFDNCFTILKSGISIGVILGGVAEIFEKQTETSETIFIKDRKGFIKLGLLTGSYIVPSFLFGHSKLFSCIRDRFGILQYISRKLGFSCTIVFGKYFLPIPRQIPLTLVLGSPIKIPKIENPTQEQIDEYHTIFVAQIQKLYEQFKGSYGWSKKKLIIK